MAKKERDEEKPEIEVNLGFGNLFKGIGNFIELLSDMAEEGKTEVSETREFRGKGNLKDLRGVYGFSVKIGLGGVPQVETFGNIKQTQQGPVVEEVREPMVDLFEEGKGFHIVVELPGVEEEEIEVEVAGDMVNLNAEGQVRKYQKEILLPAPADAASLKQSFRNGVLEIWLDREETR